MKVLIVDDEKHVREGIRLLGAWEKNGITEIFEAGNGEEAISLIQTNRPEIIFSDMKMPQMDGTRLLEWIKENQPNSKTIVVTGYDDYHYMRKALHSGSLDYLLKPIDPEILNSTLEKAVSEWKKDEAERKLRQNSAQIMNEMKPVYRDRQLTQLLKGDIMRKNWYDELSFLPSQNYLIALVRVSSKILGDFSGDQDLAYFTILNIINEMVMEKKCGVGFRNISASGEIVIVFWSEFDHIHEILKNIYQMIQNVLKVTCPIGIGIMVNESSKLMESYQHAKQVLLYSNILEVMDTRISRQDILKTAPLRSLMDYSANIELAIQAGEIGAFTDLISQIEADYTENHYLSPQQLLRFENEYLMISSRWFKIYQIPVKVSEDLDSRIDIFFDEKGTFQLEAYKYRIKREITHFLKRIKRTSEQNHSNSIYEIEKYLQANFDRDVKLQEISQHFYLSREYISRRFKQEFNVNISDYIVNIRIETAKSLLKNSHLKIYEIANMIGYQDDKYFRKVFKKVEGFTPNEYRALYV
ncbi:response regulator [Bacillus sp. BRMEA1]|uniref:response regulator transcription factor n=1 Tax=Neobacillus endophyticus TaxID=2738405 RepID=UPI001566EA29|nr:response regulator [Neobacillus endophyticus]NRD77923.1 response regulator [Neobacillus endophyticus]